MDSKTYIKKVFLIVFCLLVATAITNFIVDPGKIYPKIYSQKDKSTPSTFIEELLESEYGLLVTKNTWNDRSLKKALAEYPINYDCAIIGSSHTEQISTFRDNKSLASFCSSMKNLEVDGGTLEDYLALSNIIINNYNFLPKTVFFGIDPWSLNFGRDKRWTIYAQDYFEMKSRLHAKSPSRVLNITSKDLLLNLINLQYLKRSINSIYEMQSNPTTPIPATKFNYKIGLKLPVILPDGSYIYSAEYIEKHKNDLSKLSGKHDYKIIKNSYYQDYAIETFEKLINQLKKSQINVVLVLTPYRHKVWSHPKQPIIKNLNIIESKVHEIAKLNGIQVVGSYNPNTLGCLENEFFDNQHAMDSCLIKLENRLISY